MGASAVAPNFFEVFQMPVLAGRTFDSRDLNENANTVVVNSIRGSILGGRNAVGQRIRYESVEPTDDRRSPVKPGRGSRSSALCATWYRTAASPVESG